MTRPSTVIIAFPVISKIMFELISITNSCSYLLKA